MIYWFKRKNDGLVFPIDSEQQAVVIYKRKDFKYQYEYIGKSDGKKYKEIIATGKNLNAKEIEKLLKNNGQLNKKLSDIRDKAFKEELAIAMANPDKKPPVEIKMRDENGNPITNNLIISMLERMN